MKVRNLVKSTFALTMTLSLVACEKALETTATTATANPSGAVTSGAGAGSIKDFKIGTLGPLTGDTAVYGTATRNGAVLAVKDYNEKHGTNIHVVDIDTKGDSTQAVNGYNKLVTEDKVAGIVGATLSSESVAVATASQEVGVPVISASATVADFTLIGENIFRGCYTDPYQAKIAADFSTDTLGAKKAAIIYNTSDDYSTGMAENFTAEFKAKGGEVVTSEGYNKGDVDFSTQLTKIAATNPDVLFVPNYYKDDALIAKAAKDAGITATLVGGDGWDGVLSQVTAGSDGAKALEGAVFVNHYAPDQEAVTELLNRYKTEFGVDANAFAVLSYDTTTLLLDAIANAGSLNYSDIVKAMKTIQFEGVLGKMHFDENGDPVKDLAYVTVKDGQYVTYKK